jgi:serine phosphatase RsbU (regulator of sigma subunit)
VPLEPGDTLVLFSDGVTEAADPEEQLYGVPRLTEILTGQQDAPLDQPRNASPIRWENSRAERSQADDITLLFIRYRGAVQTADAVARAPGCSLGCSTRKPDSPAPGFK